MYIELQIKTPREIKVFNYHVTNLPRGPHYPWKLYFEVDHEQFDEDYPVKLAKMDFIKNAVLAYTEKQDTSWGADYKLKIMAACAELYNDPDFKPENEFTAAALQSNTDGIEIIETNKVQPAEANIIQNLQFGITNQLNNTDIPGLGDHIQRAFQLHAIPHQPYPSPHLFQDTAAHTSDKQHRLPSTFLNRFKACTVKTAHGYLKNWERDNGLLDDLSRNMFLWERIQGMPEDVPKDLPVGWFKPPINQDLLLNINRPKEIFTYYYQPQNWNYLSMKAVDYIRKYFFDISDIFDAK